MYYNKQDTYYYSRIMDNVNDDMSFLFISITYGKLVILVFHKHEDSLKRLSGFSEVLSIGVRNRNSRLIRFYCSL